MNGIDALDDFESFMNQSLTTDLSLELGNILASDNTILDWSKNSFVQENNKSYDMEIENLRRLSRLEDAVEQMNQKLTILSFKSTSNEPKKHAVDHSSGHHNYITSPKNIDSAAQTDNELSELEDYKNQKRNANISSQLSSICKELDSLKDQMLSIGKDSLNLTPILKNQARDQPDNTKHSSSKFELSPSRPTSTETKFNNNNVVCPSKLKDTQKSLTDLTKDEIIKSIRSELNETIKELVHKEVVQSLDFSLTRIVSEITNQVSNSITEQLNAQGNRHKREKSNSSDAGKEVKWDHPIKQFRPISSTSSCRSSPQPNIPDKDKEDIDLLLQKLRNMMNQKARLEHAVINKKGEPKRTYLKPTLSSQLKKRI
jgi:hypothetical protein